MKIAIPAFATRVSPRFDCAPAVLVVTVGEAASRQHEQLDLADCTAQERIAKLVQLDVDTVVCGGIDRWSAASLQWAGVTVYGWVSGEIEHALRALLAGELDSEAATADGRCRRFPGDSLAGVGLPARFRSRRDPGRKRGAADA